MKQQIICIAGPTASGKTALSIALAKQLDTDIISSDSMQLYRGMDIGTAKPDMAERDGVVHYMLDVADAGESFSVAKYQQMADEYVRKILSKKRIPIICGGTGLYLDALIEGNTFSGDEKNTQYRDKFRKIADEQGVHALHEMLREVDTEAADKIHENNVKRVIRALEVYYQTGMTIGEFNRIHKPAEPKYDAVIIAVCPSDREVLYERINKRVDIMIENGLAEEVKTLRDNGRLVGTAAQAIGYKELIPYLDGQAPLEECAENIKQASRQYAKRQMTWLRRDKRINWILYEKAETLDDILAGAKDIINKRITFEF